MPAVIAYFYPATRLECFFSFQLSSAPSGTAQSPFVFTL